MTRISFAKYSGCGNDFIVVDNRQINLAPHPEMVARLCHRQRGIGADGVIFLETSSSASFRMRIFNADGSEAEMCGNGIRCLAHFIHSTSDPVVSTFTIQTMHQEMHVVVNDNIVTVVMPPPTEAIRVQDIYVDEARFFLHTVDTGVPHVILFVEDINQSELFTVAPRIRFHQDFYPRGTNVNFAQVLPNKTVAVRTYERGVEQETLACGTGAVAVALAAAAAYGIPAPITIRTRSGDCLSIDFQGDPTKPNRLVMTGPAVKVYEGLFSIAAKANFE
ncbi:MAG: diaminopimelate epimerase [Parachlamydiaceae bacterium]